MGLLEDKNHFGHPSKKSRPKELLLDSSLGANQLQMLRDLLRNYSSSNTSSFGGAAMIPESNFDDVVAIQSSLWPYATIKDWIVSSW